MRYPVERAMGDLLESEDWQRCLCQTGCAGLGPETTRVHTDTVGLHHHVAVDRLACICVCTRYYMEVEM